MSTATKVLHSGILRALKGLLAVYTTWCRANGIDVGNPSSQ